MPDGRNFVSRRCTTVRRAAEVNTPAFTPNEDDITTTCRLSAALQNLAGGIREDLGDVCVKGRGGRLCRSDVKKDGCDASLGLARRVLLGLSDGCEVPASALRNDVQPVLRQGRKGTEGLNPS